MHQYNPDADLKEVLGRLADRHRAGEFMLQLLSKYKLIDSQRVIYNDENFYIPSAMQGMKS